MRKYKGEKIGPIVLLLLWVVTLNAADFEYQFEYFSIESGLSQSAVTCIVQDSRGLMWFGTQDGLNRYDGYKFTVYLPQHGNPDSLNGSFINALFVDSGGDLWIGTRAGFNKFLPESNSFRHYHKTLGGLSANDVLAIAEDQDGYLWLATAYGGLNRFDKKNESFVVYRTEVENPRSLSSNNITAVFVDSSGVLWVGTLNAGLDRFDRRSNTFTHYRANPAQPGSLSSDQVRAICEGKDGDIWVGTTNGLNQWDESKQSFKHFISVLNDPYTLSHNVIKTLFKTQAGVLMVGSEKGFNQYNPKTKNFTRIMNDPGNPSSISNNIILAIYEDPFNVLWVGTEGGGVNNYAPGRYKFPLYRDNFKPHENGLKGKYVYALHEGQDGTIWIGTDQGLNRMDRKTGSFYSYPVHPSVPDALSNQDVVAIGEDRFGVIWVGTWGGGLNKLDRKTGKFTCYRHDPANLSSISHNVIRVIYEDRQGELWLGTGGGGLNWFDRKNERFVHYQSIPDNPKSLSNDYIYSIAQDAAGVLWIGTREGLNSFDRQTQEFTCFGRTPNNPNALSSNSVSSVLVSATGVLWAGTYGEGLSRVEPVSGKVTSYRKTEGLPNNVIYGILEDLNGNLWLGTNHGLSVFNPRTGKFRNYFQQDGLQSNEFNQGAYYRCRNGELMFGGIDGFNLFHPDDIRRNSHVPPIVVTDFKVLNESVTIGPNSLLKKSIIETKEITLSHRDYVFSFEFAALDYYAPAANQYAYMMEGLDKDWTYSRTRRFVSYTTLAPGQYTFRVKGSNNDGVWNENGTSIKIIITPPFWSTWWFIILAMILLGVCIFALFRVRTHNMRRRNQQLEAMNVRLNQEIGERSQMEEKLRKSERRLKTFLHTASEGFLEVDADEFILDVNPEMCVILGRKRDGLVGRNLFDFIDPKDYDTFRQEVLLRKEGKRGSYELTMLLPDNTEINCLINAAPMFDELKHVNGSFALVTDISDIIKAEEELKRTQNYLKDVFDSLSSMLVSIDRDGKITQWNRAAQERMKLSRENAFTGKIWEVIPFLNVYRSHLENIFISRKPVEFYRESVVFDGQEKRYLDIFIYPLRRSGLEGVVIRLDDVTALEQKDRQLIQAQKMEIVGNLAGGLAHDFNNVLGGMVGTISLLQIMLDSGEAFSVENIKSRIDTIELGAERAVDLVKHLMTLSRKNEPLLAPTDLNLALKHVIKICENTFDKSIHLEIEYYVGRALVWGDATQLEQVLLNLCINAAHAMTLMRKPHESLGGNLGVSISTISPDPLFCDKHPEAVESEYWTLTVTDTGVGIEPVIIPKIFDPFFTTKSEQKGTGLGLAMVYQIVQQHRGFLAVYSEPGVGTTFSVYLPTLKTKEELETPIKPEEKLVMGTGLILVVDDEENLRDTTREILTSCGYQVITAVDGSEGLNLFRERHREIVAVLLDMAMPIMSGMEAYVEMKKINPAVKVLLTSGFKQDSRVKAVLKLGVNGFIQKPFSMYQLSREIAEVILL